MNHVVAGRSRVPGEQARRLPRCCEQHDSFDVLANHLLRCFPTLEPATIIRQLERAADAVAAVRYPDDGLVITDLITRHQLLLLTGELVDHAHLDPQPHPGRAQRAAGTGFALRTSGEDIRQGGH